jgi:non-specific serine/threonine protein kinase/serine/threonine-protein kinase
MKVHQKESMEQIICNVAPEPPSKAIARMAPHLESAQEHDEERPAAGCSSSDRQLRERLARQLRGDLDNVILMALRKEPHRRYSSVDYFSDDIRGHLNGLPVSARPDRYRYRAGKFILRNKAGVAAAALLFISLVAGMTTTVWQARRAQAAQVRAERRFNDLRELASSYLFEFHDAIANVPGTTAARALVVRRALQYLNGLAREASGDRQLQLELAAAYQKLATHKDALGSRTLVIAPARSKVIDVRLPHAKLWALIARRTSDFAWTLPQTMTVSPTYYWWSVTLPRQ